MDVIKKKMQAMKLEKDNAMDKADTCEGQAKDANLRADKVLEEVADLTKKLAQVEADLVANKQALEQANKDLEDREKSLTNVSGICIHEISSIFVFTFRFVRLQFQCQISDLKTRFIRFINIIRFILLLYVYIVINVSSLSYGQVKKKARILIFVRIRFL